MPYKYRIESLEKFMYLRIEEGITGAMDCSIFWCEALNKLSEIENLL